MAIYVIHEVYVARNYRDIEAGKEIICEVLSLEEGVPKVVKALIAPSIKELPDGHELRIRGEMSGEWKDEKWVIKILEELDQEETAIPVAPLASKPPIYGIER